MKSHVRMISKSLNWRNWCPNLPLTHAHTRHLLVFRISFSILAFVPAAPAPAPIYAHLPSQQYSPTAAMELRLGLALPTYASMKALDLNRDETTDYFKRGFEAQLIEKNDNVFCSQTLPLLQMWRSSPNNQEDDSTDKSKKRSISCSAKHFARHAENDEGDDGQYVGWPPIKSRMKKAVVSRPEGGGPSSLYVKVKMEGMAIARKVDLGLYHSYQTLTAASVAMFSKHEKGERDCTCFALTYQDSEGDWLLAGDLPWQSFVETVQRLKIVKKYG